MINFQIVLIHLIVLFAFKVQSQNSKPHLPVCIANSQNSTKIERCLTDLSSLDCQKFPKEQLRNCFDLSSLLEDEKTDYGKSCQQGGAQGIYSAIEGAKELAERIAQSFTDQKKYQTRVRLEAKEQCQKDKKVIQSQEKLKLIIQNLGSEASLKFIQESNQIYQSCLREKTEIGKNLGIDVTLPDFEEIRPMLNCLNRDAKTHVTCSVVIPMLVGGVGGAALKGAVNKGLVQFGKNKSASFQIEESLISNLADDKLKKLKSNKEISKAEMYSILHQEDLEKLFKSPEMNEKLKQLNIDKRSLSMGMFDSDLGKLSDYKKLLTIQSAKSDQLLKVLNGSDKSTPGGRYFNELLAEKGMSGQTFLNPDMTPEELRQTINSNPILTGYLHEAPGISEAIEAVNKGQISKAEFKNRIAANLFHNGPAEGFWKTLGEQFVPGSLKKTDNGKNFFKGTVFEGAKNADGVYVPKYRSAVSKEGIVHTMVDRLSQATAGGNTKIFYELMGKNLNDSPNVKIGEIPDPFEAGKTQNGLNAIRDLLVGNKSVKSNPDGTLDQLKALQKHTLQADFLMAAEKSDLNLLLSASQNRVTAFNDFLKPPQVEFKLDSDGNVESVNLQVDRFGRKEFIAKIDKNTPTSEAMLAFEKIYKAEEQLNGDPIKDLLKPRLISKTELKSFSGSAAASVYGLNYYCNQKKYTTDDATNTNKLMNKQIYKPQGVKTNQ